MGVLSAVESWWNDDGWRRLVAGVVKFGVIELLVSVSVVVVLYWTASVLGTLSVLPAPPTTDGQTGGLLSGLGVAVVYETVSCTIVRTDGDD